MIPTAATGFLRSLPETIDGIDAELLATRERLLEQLTAIDIDRARIASVRAALLIGERVHAGRLMEMAAWDGESIAA